MRKSFTLIELIVVIGIIAVLSALGATSYSGFQKNARDTRRKQDLKTITDALNQYYAANNRYPAPDPNDRFTGETGTWWTGKCDYDTNVQGSAPNTFANCYTSSTYGTNWIPELVEKGYIDALPVDPINNGKWPWVVNTDNYSYSYGNVSTDGQQYELTARLENTSDPDRCAVKNYKYTPAKANWCGSYSTQIYEYSPRSF